jgi:ribokinase
MNKILVVGSIGIDLVVQVSRAPDAGETIQGHDFKTIPGGKGANQAATVALLGGSVAMVGRTGDDTFGPELVNNLASKGVNTSYIGVEKGSLSQTAFIIVDDLGENRIIIIPGANMKVLPIDVDQALPVIRSAEYMILQFEIPLATVEYAIDLANQHGIKVILNTAPAQPVQDRLLQKVDYLILNEIEANMLTGTKVSDITSAKSAAEAIIKRGAGVVVLTLGGQGSVIASSVGCGHVPAFPVKAVDTTAAGDAFIGGFAVALSEGKDLVDATVFGNAAGALAATKIGAQSSLPSRSELDDFLRKQS